MTEIVFDLALTEQLYSDLRRANTESAKKERFLQYITNLFSLDAAAQSFVSQLSLGAERTIANIPRGGNISFGRADTQVETLIIEWERDLSVTGEHAKHQLEEYLEGNWRSGETYRFVLIATDGIKWRCYAPDWSHLENNGFTLSNDFHLREIRRFDLSPERFSEFPFFLDEVLFATMSRTPTLENVQADFGDTSSTFINCLTTLSSAASDLESQSELQVAYHQWQRFLSIAYGRFDDSQNMFLVHTYLSAFAKLIAYCVINRAPSMDDQTTREVLNGDIFNRLNVDRFVEDDFFHWVHAEEFFSTLSPAFREINRKLAEYDFSEVREDILKGVYQELIDLETRHALGEYYTPDWLCERVVDDLPIIQESRILDPACGSGSFLRAAISRVQQEFPEAGPDQIARQIVGIDIHPLSVQIAKTTVLLALGSSVASAANPVSLHVYLANSLTVPRETANLFENSFEVTVDNAAYTLDVQGMTSPEDFDQLIDFCDELVRRSADPVERERFNRLARSYLPTGSSSNLSTQLHDIYLAMHRANAEGRDTIWKFILQNSYKPIFLSGRFDFVIGNPPWLTYSGVSNGEYQNLLLSLSEVYGVTPENRANMPHLEIAAIFMAHAANYFLASGGILAFVLPRSFLSADQHENTRAGSMLGFSLTKVWDLDGVTPLFRVPSCAIFGRKTDRSATQNRVPKVGLPGLRISGRLPRSHLHLDEASDRLQEEEVRWFYSQIQATKGRKRSALTNQLLESFSGSNAYADGFRQGATIVPRNFCFVELDGEIDAGLNVDRVHQLRSSDASNREAKDPWKNKIVRGRAEGKYLFRTAISKNIVPFLLVDPLLILLPVAIETDASGTQNFQMLNSDDLLERGDRYASSWFGSAEKIWNENRTAKNAARGTTIYDYLNWQSKITDQKPSARYLVLYTSSSSDASACVVDSSQFDFAFVVDHKAYWLECNSLSEAHFVACYLNSNWANEAIKDFQSRGLFGPRDVHKTILKLPFPRFAARKPMHQELAKLGAQCAARVQHYASLNDMADLSSHALGRTRSTIRSQLSQELQSIDTIVSKLASEQGNNSH